jgi:hypothetical protein
MSQLFVVPLPDALSSEVRADGLDRYTGDSIRGPSQSAHDALYNGVSLSRVSRQGRDGIELMRDRSTAEGSLEMYGEQVWMD